MIPRAFLHLLIIAAAVLFNAASAAAQADTRFPGDHPREPPPLGVREMLEKMRISKEKKDYEEMIAHGEEVRRLTSEVEKIITQRGQLANADLDKLEVLEKNVKKIRSELGGSDDDDEKTADTEKSEQLTASSAVNVLVSSVDTLMDELKRSNRFTISVPAVEASNATLRIIRFLLHK